MNRNYLCVLLAVTSHCTGLLAQQKQPVVSEQEDCGVTFNFDTVSAGAQAPGTTTAGSVGTTAVIDNRQAGCLEWSVSYEPNSVTATVSLAFQTALDIAGVPTTWSNYPGTISSGINPNTAVTTGGAVSVFTGVQYPFLRMNMTVITGAGARIQGKLIGWKRRPPVTANAVIPPGTICTAAAPCPVDGPTADGVAPGFPPVLTAGFDGTLTQTILTDTSGRQRAVGAAADGAAAAGDPVLIAGQDGANAQSVLTDTSGRVTVIGSKTNDAAAPGTNNVGVLPCLANAAAPTFGEGNQVTCSTDLAGNLRTTATVTGALTGTKTNNAAAPGATNIGSLGAIANAAEVLYTEGFLVLPSVDLAGILRMNVSRINGVVPLMGNGATGTGSQRVTVADNNTGIANWGHGAIAAAPPVNATYGAGLNSGATGGLLGGMPICDSFFNINISSATTTLMITGVANRHVRICHINMLAAAAQNVAIISGTGATCGTGTAAIVGTSTATGYQWTAQTGISAGNGLGTIMRTVAAGDSVCFITSTTGQLSGVISYTIY